MSEETQGLSMPSLGVQGKGRSNLPGRTVGEGGKLCSSGARKGGHNQRGSCL